MEVLLDSIKRQLGRALATWSSGFSFEVLGLGVLRFKVSGFGIFGFRISGYRATGFGVYPDLLQYSKILKAASMPSPRTLNPEP